MAFSLFSIAAHIVKNRVVLHQGLTSWPTRPETGGDVTPCQTTSSPSAWTDVSSKTRPLSNAIGEPHIRPLNQARAIGAGQRHSGTAGGGEAKKAFWNRSQTA